MSLTRKDFKAIADELRTLAPDPPRYPDERRDHAKMWKACCERVAQGLSQTNKCFDRGRFLEASGVE